MNPQRRRWLRQIAQQMAQQTALQTALQMALLPMLGTARAQPTLPEQPDVQAGRPLRFPQDHGAHLQARTEWWYATGWLGNEAAPTHGFQITFFRSRTGLAEGSTSRFAARHLLFAHAAVTHLATRTHGHDQRIARWSGAADAATGHAAVGRGAVQLADWSLRDEGPAWHAVATGHTLALDLKLTRTQPLLLQGDAGTSRKGQSDTHFSHYLSEPQLAATGRVVLQGQAVQASGRAWLDHEWADAYLAPGAVGWDWLGFNLFDGSALTAFVLRRADGSALWAGGSFRTAGAMGQPPRSFGPTEVRFTPGPRWRSPATGASYPVQWQVDTPAGRFKLRALLDAQELDSRASTGTGYWEGLSELLDTQGRRVGLGYREMTGYAGALKM